MDDVVHAGGEGGVAGGVIAVIGRDDDVVIGFGVTFLIASTSPFVSAGLPWPSATSTPSLGDDEHVGRRELLGAGVEILVGVDVVGDLDRARKIAQLACRA